MSIERVNGREMAIIVVEYLVKNGRRTGAQARDDRAARCGSKGRVEAGIYYARVHGWIQSVEGYWEATDKGRAELAGKVAA